jgi:Restriction endonuclease NaeI
MTGSDTDEEMLAVAAWLRSKDPDGSRVARVLRDTLDQLYDGQRTGRYRPDQLMKTEKTHCGTLVEINLQREFVFDDGALLDYKIEGIEVDCKHSGSEFGWMIPPEAIDQICLVVWADDMKSQWSLGLVRMTQSILRGGENRDKKTSISEPGRSAIHWLHKRAELPPNVLLHQPQEVIDKIFSHKNGTKRLDELFRLVQQQRIGRGTVATVAQQADYMRRVRANGGSRTPLQSEGIVIFGQYKSHADIALALGIPVPRSGESVSCRLTSCDPGSVAASALVDGSWWRTATPGDAATSAPTLPRISRDD